MAWAYFQNQAAWDTYHNAVCTTQAIPRPWYLAADNATVMINNQWTDAWVEPLQFKQQGNVTTWVAQVPDADVITYGLNAIPDENVVFSDPLVQPVTVTVRIGNRTYVNEPLTMNFRKAKPPTWTDPKTGTVYQVPQ